MTTAVREGRAVTAEAVLELCDSAEDVVKFDVESCGVLVSQAVCLYRRIISSVVFTHPNGFPSHSHDFSLFCMLQPPPASQAVLPPLAPSEAAMLSELIQWRLKVANEKEK